jgi:ribosomal protein S18 acetylase RimI-like enzyme
MMQLIPVSNSIELNEELQEIYFESFPPDERREWQDLTQLLQNPNFTLNKIINYNDLIGLICLWNLQDWLYIEHFAIVKPMQDRGIGTLILKKLIEKKATKIVLEVEEPTSLSAKRRIEFYSRLGFHICNEIYYQPPYSPNKNKVKMLLMSYPDKLISSDFERIKALIYQLVYNQSE